MPLSAFANIAEEPAVPAEVDGITVFPAAFYVDGEPVSALEIATRTPGFTLSMGNAQLRGLETAAGNVLIDGRRPTTKSLMLTEVLASIPFSTVERAELIRAGTDGYDMMGQRVLLNIVRKSDSAPTFAVEGTVEAYPDNDRNTGGSGRIEYTRSTGRFGLDASFQLASEQSRTAGEGDYAYEDIASGASLSGNFDADDWNDSFQGVVKASFALDRFDVDVNFSAIGSDLTIDQVSDYETGDGDSFSEIVAIDRGFDIFETGVDTSGSLADNLELNVKLLHRAEARTGDSNLQVGDLQVDATDEFDAYETAARGLLRWNATRDLSFEFGAEAAYNRLDSLVGVSTDGVPLDLPNSDITVEEDRYLASVNATWQANSEWLLEAGVDFETSRLTQSGDANLEKAFDYVKPRFVVSRPVGDSTHLRLRYEKVVGQLNFDTFAASPSLESGLISAGNAELEPEESAEYEVQLEQRFWDEGSVLLSYRLAEIDNTLDYIPVGDFDALGNAGEGTRSTLELDMTLPLDRLGWSGATFRTRSTYLDSEISDPFTGESRLISARNGFTGSFGLTWELPDYQSVVGIDGYWGYTNYAYRLAEERRESEEPGTMSLWWDKTFGNGYTLRAEAHNLTQQRRERFRDMYADGRESGIRTAEERRTTVQEPHLILKLRKRF